MMLTGCRNQERITISKICNNARVHKLHSLSVEIEKGSGLRSVKCKNVETRKMTHSLSRSRREVDYTQ